MDIKRVYCRVPLKIFLDMIQSFERFSPKKNHFKLMTVPALVHQMSFTGSVSGIKRKMTGFEETHGWHLTAQKHRNGGIFKRPRL